MKKFIVILFLIISFIQVKIYPYQTSLVKVINNKRHIESVKVLSNMQITQYAKKEYKFPQMLTVGAVGICETIAGFTLAEVLITLLIVEIVGSIVIPAIIQDTQNAELKTAWKKAYSDFEQATRKSLIDYGGSFKGVCQSSNPNCLRDIYLQHLSYMKKCDLYNSYGKCWHDIGEVKWLNGHILTSSEMHAQFNDGPAAVLTNGSYVMIYPWTDLCNTGGQCGWIAVDVNGKKLPNTAGKDMFVMYVYNSKIVPAGGSCSGSGWGCSGEYLK